MKSLKIIFLSVLFILSSCSKEIIPPHRYNSDFLDVMGRYRIEQEGYFTLISGSGVVATLQTNLKNDLENSLPCRGIYKGSLKYLDQWKWSIEAREDYSMPSLARPDVLERKIVGSVVEKITLHPDSACGIIELEGKYSGVSSFSPFFDLRSLVGRHIEFSTQWDNLGKVFLVSSESGKSFALVSNGEWMPGEEINRVEYANPWQPCEQVVSTSLYGRFSFLYPARPIVAFGIGNSPEEAAQLAQSALANSSELKKRAEKRVLNLLNERAFWSQDERFRAIAAWDHWFLEMSRIRTLSGEERIINRPPLPSYNDLGANGTVLPALYLAGSNTDLGYTIGKSLTPETSLKDPEGFLIGMNGLFESYIFENNSSLVDSFSSENSRGLELLLDWALKNGTIQYLPDLTRWDIDVRNSGLPPDTLRLKLGIDDLLSNTIGTIRLATDRKARWYEDYMILLSGKMRLPRFSLPIHNIILNPPDNWNSDIAMVHQIASEMPACNLALVDRNLRGESRRDTRQLAEMALRLWVHVNGGLRVNSSEMFSDIAFTAPLWRAWRCLRSKNQNTSPSIALSSYMNPEYATWYRSEGGEDRKVPGGSIQDAEVVAERLKFLYENILGITCKPGHGILNIAPTGSESFWKGKATRVEAGFGSKKIILYIDPARGIYRFENTESNVDIVVNLEDIPKDGFMLSGQIRLAPGDMIEVVRKPDNRGRNTLTIDGVELINVVRREI